jgi:hypothetical protein
MISFRDLGYLGRLGNQLFQFSTTIGVSRMRGFTPVFPIENSELFRDTGPIDPTTGKRLETRCELLECFDLCSDIFIDSRLIQTTHRFIETDFNYNQSIELIPDNVDLFGYFQNERYFSHIRKELLEILKFKKEHVAKSNSFLSEINKTDIRVSLHIRRGDYINLSNFHPICTIDYYNKAIDALSAYDATFLIFSDDINWTKENIKTPNSVFVEIKNPYSELYLMTQCHHHIIANSSFSWWGAWLSESEGQKVIAPSRWFGESMNKDTSGIYCKNWIII